MADNKSKKPVSKNEGTPIREGQEDSSILHDMDRKKTKSYPRATEPDRQFDNQPEFLEPDGSKQDEETS